jgi:hypothetical protein
MDRSHITLLPAMLTGAMVLFYFVWAAMHDIAHGDEGTIEWIGLAVCALAFAGLYRLALRHLSPKAKLIWFITMGLLFSLFSVAAAAAIARPKYDKDPLLATTFLIAAVPVLGLIGYHLMREALQARARRGLES